MVHRCEFATSSKKDRIEYSKGIKHQLCFSTVYDHMTGWAGVMAGDRLGNLYRRLNCCFVFIVVNRQCTKYIVHLLWCISSTHVNVLFFEFSRQCSLDCDIVLISGALRTTSSDYYSSKRVWLYRNSALFVQAFAILGGTWPRLTLVNRPPHCVLVTGLEFR